MLTETIKSYLLLVSTLVLTAVLLLPSIIKLNHFLEGHEHIISNEKSTHVHEKIADCDSCHIQLENFNYDELSYLEIIEIIIPSTIEIGTKSFVYSLKINYLQLRGPPSQLI